MSNRYEHTFFFLIASNSLLVTLVTEQPTSWPQDTRFLTRITISRGISYQVPNVLVFVLSLSLG